MKKVFALLLTVLMTITCFAACNPTSSSSSSGGNNTTTEVRQNADAHVNNSKITNKYVMVDSVTDYTILYPEDAGDKVQIAVQELLYFFKEATGVRLNRTTSYVEGNKYISLGNTAVAAQVDDFEFTSDFKYGGFRIVTEGDNIVINGWKEPGVLNGVYELLTLMFDYDYFYSDTFYIKRNVRKIPLYDYDVLEIPDIEHNHNQYGFLEAEELNRYRYYNVDRFIMKGHNAREIVGYPETLEAHPKWFSAPVDPKQPCYTAHGDEAEYALMQQQALSYLINVVKKAGTENPDKNIFSFGNQDNNSYCSCKECTKWKEDYGSVTATWIKYLNDLRKLLVDWMETEEGLPYKREVIFTFYAYAGYVNAPTKANENGEQVAMFRCDDGVIPRIAFLHANYTVPFSHEKNANWMQMIKNWQKCANAVYMYWYNTNYHYILAPYSSYNSIRDNYRVAYECNVSYMNILSQPTQAGYSNGYNVLNAYLCSKLGWNIYADVNSLTEKFFTYYFEDASDIMYDQFMDYRSWTLHLENDFKGLGYSGLYSDPTSPDYWPQALLEKWMDSYVRALDAIAYIKESNPQRYQELYDHIVGERTTTWYLYIEIYGKDLPEAIIMPMKREFKADAERLGLTRRNESQSISQLWTAWGV